MYIHNKVIDNAVVISTGVHSGHKILTLENCAPCEKPIILKPPLSSFISASCSQTLPTCGVCVYGVTCNGHGKTQVLGVSHKQWMLGDAAAACLCVATYLSVDITIEGAPHVTVLTRSGSNAVHEDTCLWTTAAKDVMSGGIARRQGRSAQALRHTSNLASPQ